MASAWFLEDRENFRSEYDRSLLNKSKITTRVIQNYDDQCIFSNNGPYRLSKVSFTFKGCQTSKRSIKTIFRLTAPKYQANTPPLGIERTNRKYF